MKKRNGKWLSASLMAAMLLGTAVSGAEISQNEQFEILDVLENLDMDSVTEEAGIVSFQVTTDAGEVIRFQGSQMEVTEDGIFLEPGACIYSLDSLGEIQMFSAAADQTDNWFSFGGAYADTSNVEDMTELHAKCYWSNIMEAGTVTDVSMFHGGFFALEYDAQNSAATVTELTITYDPSVEALTYSEMLNGDKDVRELLKDYITDEEVILASGDITECDVIAGIDRSSIVNEGSSTFFESVMADGTVVRFVGENIAIVEDGIQLSPGSTITSLDAIGKIYSYGASMSGAQDEMDNMSIGYGYTYSAERTSVAGAEEIHTYSTKSQNIASWNAGNVLGTEALEPNFVHVISSEYNTGDFILSRLMVGYDSAEKVTGIKKISFADDIMGAYLEGEPYKIELEEKTDQPNYNFYLILQMDTEASDMNQTEQNVYFVPGDFYTIGDLKNAEGAVLDKTNALVSLGDKLDIQIGDYALELELPVLERFKNASTMHDLVPYAFPEALGEKNTLVVPVIWADQTEMATEENLDLYRKAFGRVMAENGSLTDYSVENGTSFSLSDYFEKASYGKLKVNSFITDWYYSDKTFAEWEEQAVDKSYGDEILEWVKCSYPDLDWSLFDQDANGYVDSIVLVNAGTSQSETVDIQSYGGASHYRETYYGNYAGTQEDPQVNTFVTINQRFLEGGETRVLIHEFSHNFGLIDYYDVTYSGINAVGGFDMQSDNVGDWNAYSKLTAGWMNPQVVENLASGESIELTIGSMALTDDVILLPAAGTAYEGPFSEYVMIDLFSDDGTNVYDTEQYGLKGAAGVRISHVDAYMEQRTQEIVSEIDPSVSEVYTIGTIHFSNANQNDEKGRYNIEVIQSGKKNTFTNLKEENTRLTAEDLFYAGDVFTAEEYSEFFYEGRLDSGKELGYTVTIVRIDTDEDGMPCATIRITAD